LYHRRPYVYLFTDFFILSKKVNPAIYTYGFSQKRIAGALGVSGNAIDAIVVASKM